MPVAQQTHSRPTPGLHHHSGSSASNYGVMRPSSGGRCGCLPGDRCHAEGHTFLPRPLERRPGSRTPRRGSIDEVINGGVVSHHATQDIVSPMDVASTSSVTINCGDTVSTNHRGPMMQHQGIAAERRGISPALCPAPWYQLNLARPMLDANREADQPFGLVR